MPDVEFEKDFKPHIPPIAGKQWWMFLLSPSRTHWYLLVHDRVQARFYVLDTKPINRRPKMGTKRTTNGTRRPLDSISVVSPIAQGQRTWNRKSPTKATRGYVAHTPSTTSGSSSWKWIYGACRWIAAECPLGCAFHFWAAPAVGA